MQAIDPTINDMAFTHETTRNMWYDVHSQEAPPLDPNIEMFA